MLVFSTRLPIKDEISKEACLRLFIEWITKSPNYSVERITYDVSSDEDYDYTEGNITFSIRHFTDKQIAISACRLENRESNVVWINDCIFLCENGKKSLLVQLNCNRNDYSTQLPPIHKPYIVRQFVERGFCRYDNGIPVVDTPLKADTDYFEECVDIINGIYNYAMPAVYVSCDYWGETVINPSFLARQLSGVAHVFYEQNYETTMKMRERTDGKNVYTGYVGIYFPGSKFCQRRGLSYYSDFKEMTQDIINSVWKALINRLDSSVYNWNQIIALQAKQKMLAWQDVSEQNKEQLATYMMTFDAENESLREQIKELNQQVFSLDSQLDSLRAALSGEPADKSFYKMGSEPNLYISERNDLLYSILSQVIDRYSKDSRAYVIIKAMLEANPKVGECERVIAGVKDVFAGGGKLSKAGKAQLKSLGFTIEEDGPHYKLIFHDPRYMFTVAKTPSDYREGENLISSITNTIDIGKKI